MGATEVGDVEALDPHRRRVEPEGGLEPFERLDPALPASLGAQLLLVERETRVALRELEDAALLAALGGAQLDWALATARERVLERRTLADLALHDEQRRDRDLPAVVLEHELLGDLAGVALGLV